MAHRIYTREDCGCYADGSYGPEHVDRKVIEIAEECGFHAEVCASIVRESMLSNYGEMREEDGDMLSTQAEAAVDYLNNGHVEAGISFQFIDGDLLLISDDEAE